MNCPVDATPLAMTDRSGVEIDYCPCCRGVWLDRGELDKIIERVGEYTPQTGRRDAESPSPRPQGRRKHNRLSELFDFGD
jgi:hypothetical protein